MRPGLTNQSLSQPVLGALVHTSIGAGALAGPCGFSAIDWLVSEAPGGERSLRVLLEEIGAGTSLRLTFLKAFGIEINAFYRQFEPFRLALASNPQRALASRPALMRASDEYLVAVLGEDAPV